MPDREGPTALEEVRQLRADLAAAREFIQYVRDGNAGHISDEGIEWADRLLVASAPEEPQA